MHLAFLAGASILRLVTGQLGIANFGRLLAAALLIALSVPGGHAAPAIIITNLPTYGTTNHLAGLVSGVDPTTCAVALFIDVPPWGWWSKPTCAQPLTAIRPDGSWSANISTSSADTNATRIAALLVSTNYNQPCVLGDLDLSTNIYSQALASAIVTRPSPGIRWIRFSGYDWWVKDYSSPVGPGPNYYSASVSNVWTDAEGRLHLRISNRSNQWQCAEVATGRTFGYGNYRFELDSDVDRLDPNVVLGLFTWSDDPAWANRQIDIECSRWNNPADTDNSQFVVSPYNLNGHLMRYRTTPGITNSTHLWTWESNRIAFQCQAGSYAAVPATTNLMATFGFTNAAEVLQTGDETARINLWLFNGAAPTDNQEVEFVVKSFQFVPLGPPPPATLAPGGKSPGGAFQFVVKGQFDRRYQVQTTTNLVAWQPLDTVLATNFVLTIQETNAPGSDWRFYRTVTVP